MAKWVALFRGINVGGHHLLPMKQLTTMLQGAGFENVRTYIQSGNVVFESRKGSARALSEQIADLVAKQHHFAPSVIVCSARALASAAAANPFAKQTTTPQWVHLVFLAQTPRQPDLAGLEQLKVGEEAFALHGKVLYLYTPHGAGNSKLAARAERLLGVPATARNWLTVTKLLQMQQVS